MKRKDAIDQLMNIQYTIELYDKWITEPQGEFAASFPRLVKEHKHRTEIRINARSYWKRRFNRILNNIKH